MQKSFSESEQLKEIESLKAKGYTKDQIEEIIEGMKKGLDVKLYSNKEFLSVQMREIRLGLEDKLYVQRYASTEFDWFQMEEIRKGLKEDLDIDMYASPRIPFDRMHEIRLGLKDNIDLTKYRSLEAGVLKQLRLAIISKVNIMPYIKEGYDMEQLEAIRMGFEKGLNIEPFLSKQFRGISIQEICNGVEHGVDVSVYAKPEYYWQQMREIRLGLENMVDVTKYLNHYYSWQQMREIRLGLLEGLDVTFYRSLMYTASEMEVKRLKLKEHKFKTDVTADEVDSVKDKYISDNIEIFVSEDEMVATLKVKGNLLDINKIDLLKILRDNGVTFGILYDEIDSLYEAGKEVKDVNIVIAKGIEPVDGKDGYYEYFFRTEVTRTPKVLEDGSVDFRDVDWFEIVEKNQKLCTYHFATSGDNGMNVAGEVVTAKRGKEKSILTGSGFKRLSDGVTYIATTQGIVTTRENVLNVSKILVMDNVNLATGDVEFDGCVLVNGNVASNASIKATKDVIVRGYVENAKITSGGNVTIHQGMNAKGNGFIHADGDVMGFFFEAAEVEAGGNINGDYFLNCTLHAGKKITVKGKKAALAGGQIVAEEGLRTGYLGNQAGLKTTVKLGVLDRIDKRMLDVDLDILSATKKLESFENAHREYELKYPVEVRNEMPYFLKLESAVYTMEKEIDQLNKEKNELIEEKKRKSHVAAIIDEEVFSGVTVIIDNLKWTSTNLKEVALKRTGNKITVCAIDSLE